MLRATRTFTAAFRGEAVEVVAGQTYLDPMHELARAHADAFEPEAAERVEPSNGAAHHRAHERHNPRRLDLADELRLRAERLAEIRDRQRTPRPAPDATASFWLGVERLLDSADPQRVRERREAEESERMLDAMDAARAATIRSEVDELSAWLRD